MKKLLAGLIVLSAITSSAFSQQNNGNKTTHHEQLLMQKLNLSEDQQGQMQQINDDFRKEMSEIKQKNPQLSAKEVRNKKERLKIDHEQKIVNILTPEQKSRWQKMKKEKMVKQYNKDRTGMREKPMPGLIDDEA